jgi:hypothetical protein
MYMQMYKFTDIQEHGDGTSGGQEGRNTMKIHEGQVTRNTSKGAYTEEREDRNTAEHIPEEQDVRTQEYG